VSRPTAGFEFERFADHLSLERGLSERTVRAYERDLRRLVVHLRTRNVVHPAAMKATDLRTFVFALHAQGLAPSSIRRAVSAVRTWVRFLVDEGVLDHDPTDRIEVPRAWRALPDTLSVSDVERILDAVALDSRVGWRDAAILEVLYASGMRVSELTGLTLDALHLDDGLCKVMGKGSKERLVPLGSAAIRALRRYLDAVRPGLAQGNSQRAVFLNQRGGPLSRTSVWSVVKSTVSRAGLTQRVSPHTFRHSCATHLLEGGADLAVVQELLGHADISTTEIYTHVDREYLRAEHRRFHPRG